MRVDGQADGNDATAAPVGRHGRTRATATRPCRAIPGSTGRRRSSSCRASRVGYVWHAGVHAAEVAAGLERIGFELVSQVIWDKGLFAMGRSWYHWGHEPCWVVRRHGAKVPFLGERNQSTVWRAPSPKMIMAGSDEAKLDHPTQKPVVLFETPIRNHTPAGRARVRPVLWLRDRDRGGGGARPACYGDGDRSPLCPGRDRALGAVHRADRRASRRMSQAPRNNATMAAVPLGRQGGHSSIGLLREIRQIPSILSLRNPTLSLDRLDLPPPAPSRATRW